MGGHFCLLKVFVYDYNHYGSSIGVAKAKPKDEVLPCEHWPFTRQVMCQTQEDERSESHPESYTKTNQKSQTICAYNQAESERSGRTRTGVGVGRDPIEFLHLVSHIDEERNVDGECDQGDCCSEERDQ